MLGENEVQTIKADLFDPTPEVDAICIPTNGQVKRNGRAVMGAGVAKIARDKWPGLDLRLGHCLCEWGNRLQVLTLTKEVDYHIIAFPTKHHWKDKSDLELIERAAKDLRDVTSCRHWRSIWLPVVGCGLGGLSWRDQVEPLLSSILDDRFVVVMKD